MTRVPPLVQFRHHVDALIQFGQFKAPEDPLIYAIKEKQLSEIAHRIESTIQKESFELPGPPSWTVSRSHLARIFFRDDILGADDYQFLFSNLTDDSRHILLTQLVKGNCHGFDVMQNGNVWISEFLKNYGAPRSAPNQYDRKHDILMDGALVKLLSIHVRDPQEAGKIHLEIERALALESRPVRFNVELHYLKTAFTRDEGVLPTRDQANAWLDEYQIVQELRRENAKIIVGKTQVNLITNQLKYLSQYGQLKGADMQQLEKVAQVLMRNLEEDLDHLVEAMKQPASKAINTFGKPEAKGEGARIPGAMAAFASVLQNELVPADKSKQLLELMVVTLLSTNHKNMDKKEISGFIDLVKDQVDWKVVLDSLNAKGRAALIEVFPDTKYFRAYLPRAERGQVLEQDLGM